MKQLQYQEKAINQIVSDTIDLLNTGTPRQKLVFEAPTGSGKTVMACEALARIVERLHEQGNCLYQEVAFIWFAPRKLHLQSYGKLRLAYHENRRLSPVMFDELDQSEGIQPGEILFVNWASVDKDKNVMARESESSASIYEIARRTQHDNNLPIVVVIDEEHLHWTKTSDKSAQVLDRINPAVEIRISATPKSVAQKRVTVLRNEVIEAEMIKREVILNPDITIDINDERTLNEHLIESAMRKRQQLEDAYKSLGVNINPLLLIQLPNDSSEKMTADDTRIAEQVKDYLKVMKNISVENGRLAVWLSSEKANLEGLEEHDNMAQVLLFKEAIALGWDCPRAAVLLIFRKLQSDTFTIQTVGRILRMPEQKFYPNSLLNVGYVYTDIAKDKIQIVAADASYLKNDTFVAYRRKDLNNVTLTSVYSERPNASRNYLGPDFRGILYRTAEEFWKLEKGAGLFSIEELASLSDDDEDFAPLPESNDEQINENRKRVQNTIRLDVKNVNVEIPADVHFQNEEQIIEVKGVKFSRTMGEIDRVFIDYINKHGSQFESKGRTDKIASYLLEMLADFFGIFETEAKKVVLYRGSASQPNNRKVFDRLLDVALERYATLRKNRNSQQPARKFTPYEWTVPEERYYNKETNHIEPGDAHALEPFYQLNQASNPEKAFAQFLEKNKQFIDWWYKNGDEGKQHYSIKYVNSAGKEAPFYVDFVIRMNNGNIYLFDTKGNAKQGDIDGEVENKHNALIDYVAQENANGKKLHGSIIKQDKWGNWLYCPYKITDAGDTTGWSIFEPINA